MPKRISIVTPCYNEEANVVELFRAVKEACRPFASRYRFEHIFIDNCSTDGTVDALKAVARRDKSLKVIVNARNFGHIRSPFHGIVQAQGDAVIFMAADFQDPPAILPELIRRWEQGHLVVAAIKTQSKEMSLFFALRKLYYRLVKSVADVSLINDFTGFGLYDKRIIDILRQLEDPYPYFRGLIAEIGFKPFLVEFLQPLRKRGITKNNFYSLYDMAMLGLTSHSRVPLRLATMLGFLAGAFSLLTAVAYLIYKLMFWNSFQVGTAPLVIGLFFFTSVQLFFLGILGEYLGNIQTQVLKRPRVIERERINF